MLMSDVTTKLAVGLVVTLTVGWAGWSSITSQETDRVQEAVLARLQSLEGSSKDLHAQLANLPERIDGVVLQRLSTLEITIKDLRERLELLPERVDIGDRWHKTEQMLYQENVEHRLKRLEMYHPPESYLNNPGK